MRFNTYIYIHQARIQEFSSGEGGGGPTFRKMLTSKKKKYLFFFGMVEI